MTIAKLLMRSVGVAAVLAAAGISQASAQQMIAPASATPTPGPMPDILQKYAPVTAERLKKPEDGNWLMFRRTYDGWGYSPLADINPENVSRLQPVWSFATGQTEGHQAPPIVNNGVMFVATPGNQLIALEAKSGKVLWRYKRPFPEDMVPLHPTNRGVGLYGDKVFFAAAEAVLVALDAKTGKEVWSTKVDDYQKGYYMSLAPLVIDGKVLLGASGGEVGVRGFLAAFDTETGKQLWKTYTIPAPGEPGSETWPPGGEHYKHGGGSIWITGVYDPEEIKAWTLGSKNRFLDQRLQLNAEVFYWDYTDQQIVVDAVNAGVDELLMPRNVPLAIQSLLDAVADGTVPERRIDQSVRRILKTKTFPPYVSDTPVVGTPEHLATMADAAARSITVLRRDAALPLQEGQHVLVTGWGVSTTTKL